MMVPAAVVTKLVQQKKYVKKIGIEYFKTLAAFHQTRPRGGAVGSDNWVGEGLPLECGSARERCMFCARGE
jgi:hypothetical protein